ncbi:MAG: galactose mutarotase [Colwellia sp.]
MKSQLKSKLLSLAVVVGFTMPFISGCVDEKPKAPEPPEQKISVKSSAFGNLDSGQQVTKYTLANDAGTSVSIIDLGAAITELNVIDNKGNFDDVVLGFATPQQYLTSSTYFGAVVGRYGNRIAKGKFSIDGKEYTLATNDGENHLHGGDVGFDKRFWNAKVNGKDSITFTLVSENGDEGYPGTLTLAVTYQLTDDNRLVVDYDASTDKTTVVNVTQHSYFNLAGHGSGDILNHEMMINADRFTPVDKTLIPTGELAAVEGTAMDFNQATKIGERINNDEQQLAFGGGYDHNWVLNKKQPGEMSLAAQVFEQNSGRTLAIYTDEPAIQFYSGNFLDGSYKAKNEAVYQYRNGFCLETQHFPDSPNQPSFPSTILQPGEQYKTRTIFEFGVK